MGPETAFLEVPESAGHHWSTELVLKPGGGVVFKAHSDAHRREDLLKGCSNPGLPLAKHNML